MYACILVRGRTALLGEWIACVVTPLETWILCLVPKTKFHGSKRLNLSKISSMKPALLEKTQDAREAASIANMEMTCIFQETCLPRTTDSGKRHRIQVSGVYTFRVRGHMSYNIHRVQVSNVLICSYLACGSWSETSDPCKTKRR